MKKAITLKGVCLNIKRLVLLICFVLLALLVLKNISPSNSKPFTILGYRPYIITTASMEPKYKTNSFVIIKNTSIAELKEGDVIAYKSDAVNGNLAMHRVVKITDDGVYTKGDNNQHIDNQIIDRKTYVGKCTFHTNVFAGYITAIKKPNGFIIYFTIPLAALFIGYYAFKKLIKVNKNKKKGWGYE